MYSWSEYSSNKKIMELKNHFKNFCNKIFFSIIFFLFNWQSLLKIKRYKWPVISIFLKKFLNFFYLVCFYVFLCVLLKFRYKKSKFSLSRNKTYPVTKLTEYIILHEFFYKMWERKEKPGNFENNFLIIQPFFF